MTKLKNTKKGMAKKALSVSLVAAMLATSNVPVWAAEDLFTDGSVETTTSAETQVELFSDSSSSTVEENNSSDLFRAVTSESTIDFTIGDNPAGELLVGDKVTVKASLKYDTGADASFALKVSYGSFITNNIWAETGEIDRKVITMGNEYEEYNFEVLTAHLNAGYIKAEIINTTNNTTVAYKYIPVSEHKTVVDGEPTIVANNEENEIRYGSTLTAKTDGMTKPEGTEFKYQWQYYDNTQSKWVNIDNGTNATLSLTDVKRGDFTFYQKKIRVGVYVGQVFEELKAGISKEVTVGAKKLGTADNPGGLAVTGSYPTRITLVSGSKEFNSDIEANKLKLDQNTDDTELLVKYIPLGKDESISLIPEKDYTVSYNESELRVPGTVNVTIHILPTANTDYTDDIYVGLTYKLEAESAEGYSITLEPKTYEYTGQKIEPAVAKVTDPDGQTLPKSSYTVEKVGPNAGQYTVYVNIKGVGSVYKNNGEEVTVTIEKKDMGTHDSDFEVVIPDAVWNAGINDVQNNTVKNAKIKMYDVVADPNKTNDLLAGGTGFTIKAVNWSEANYEKSIKIKAQDNNRNYTGQIFRDGTVTKADINQFETAFRNRLNEGANLIYNGRLQDKLRSILNTNHNFINLDGVNLYLNKDFTYEIISGGINAGDVSYKITGQGDYADTEMILSNAYEILQANFSSVNDVYDNRNADGEIEVPFDPSLGDKGAIISNYETIGKDVYKAYMKDGDYELELGKDFWLDTTISTNTTLEWTPTVAESTVEGHGKNENFKQDEGLTKRDKVTATLVPKDLSSEDISVEILDASYNSGETVIPKIQLVYTDKNGGRTVINSDYYEVRMIEGAVNEGETGKINVIAKEGLNASKYPQMYTGNQMAEFTVGTPSLEGGKIVALNGLETLPSVAYDAGQAATSQGIILEEGQYYVRDKSGNIVDPRFYDVTFSNNKAAGTATITVTGKAPYEGSVSATFEITNALLPSGTVTLMSDNLSKAYTGEEIKLVKGTDYTISGDLAKLTEGTDYMLVYENAVNVTSASNPAKVKFVGIGNYAGEIVRTFSITPAKITADDITLGDTTYAGGKTIEPSVTITVPGGSTTLTAGTDYTVDYVPSATNVGDTGKVVITYNEDNKNINGADSVKEVEYGVTAKDLKDVTIAPIEAQEATGEQIKPELSVMNGSVELTEGVDYEVSYGENTEVGVGTVTITAAADNKNYTGTQTIEFSIIEAVPEVGQAVISNIRVSGNTVTPVLSGDVDGAVGYDYVISTSDDVTDTASRVDVSKNILNTNTNFYYVETGTYYVYCHAWMRDENGLKVFGDWSNVMPVEVTAVTPERPMIQSAKLKGNTLTVTWSRSADATGYDIVMGKAARKVNGEMRPVDYGKAVKKITNGDTVTVTFRNIPKGTYYVGLHAWNRTSESGVKVFSPWSNGRKVVVK